MTQTSHFDCPGADLPAGTYTVKWDAVATDGHESNDRYKFTVTTPSQPGAIRLFLDGHEVQSDVPIQIVNNSPMVHNHGTMYQNPAGTPAPTVKVTVTPDAESGFNVKVEPTNFNWAPEKVNTAPVAGEGHAHLYVDGSMVARLQQPCRVRRQRCRSGSDGFSCAGRRCGQQHRRFRCERPRAHHGGYG